METFITAPKDLRILEDTSGLSPPDFLVRYMAFKLL